MGWLKNILEAHVQAISLPENMTHADEPIYHLADESVLLDAALNENRNFQNICIQHFSASLAMLYKAKEYDPVSKCQKIYHFMRDVYPDLSPNLRGFFNTKQDIFSITEKILNKRVSKFLSTGDAFYWECFFNNAQLFIDLYLFRLYCFGESGKVISDYLRSHKDHLNFTLLCVIAAAAHADLKLEKKEVALFQLFAKHTFLNEERKKAAHLFLKNGALAKHIDLPENSSWAVRKFLLELAIATAWSDEVLDKAEEDFISDFGRILKITETDIQCSHLRVEFLLLRYNAFPASSANMVMGKFLPRVKHLLSSYNQEIIQQFKSDKWLCTKLKQAASVNLDTESKIKLSHALLKRIDSLSIFRSIHLSTLELGYEKVITLLPRGVVKSVIN